MDPRRFHKKRTRPDAMDIPVPENTISQHFRHDVSGPDPSYCNRSSASKSNGELINIFICGSSGHPIIVHHQWQI